MYHSLWELLSQKLGYPSGIGGSVDKAKNHVQSLAVLPRRESGTHLASIILDSAAITAVFRG